MITSLPNILTYGRIALVPALVACFFFEGETAEWTALAIFAIAGLTDFLDGLIARAWHLQSDIGRMLDPIADKLLVASTLVMLTSNGRIAGFTLIAAVIILCREILVSGLREYLAEVKVSVPVSRLAKWKTAVQMVAIGFLLAGDAGNALFAYSTTVGIVGLWIAAILTLYTGYDYLRAGIVHVIDYD